MNINDLKSNFAKDYEIFKNNEIYKAAGGMFIIQIGELAKHLSDDFINKHTSIPWHEVKGLRNIYAHEYHNVKHTVIWDTITNDVPILEKFCDTILEKAQQLHTTDEISKAIINEFQNNNDLNTVEKNIISKIDAPSKFEKKIKFKTALKHACKNRSIRKIVEKEQDLER